MNFLHVFTEHRQTNYDPPPQKQQKNGQSLTPAEATQSTITVQFHHIGIIERFTISPQDESILFVPEILIQSQPVSYEVHIPMTTNSSYDRINAAIQELPILRRMGIGKENRKDIIEDLNTNMELYFKNNSTDNVCNVLFSVYIADAMYELLEYSEYEEELITIAELQSMEDEVKLIPASKLSIQELEKLAVHNPEYSCRICLDEIEMGNEAIRMPCSHCYHHDCIVQWLQISHSCPICRYEMPAELEPPIEENREPNEGQE
ncbi:probable E3 ubiquitin-protein ligase RHC2A [Mercurialis annua]|uniref:probable E3 ubiquitin-protein ligase RHC2A n=1 Tax=Mercurialis annua TaxID=3986 RepID=UPI0021609B52|nr:probable E3 ubiquitin-protein ligase RHC2A [Mercurialis annua]